MENHLAFFANILGPHLGSCSLVSDSGVYRPQYPSAMAKDLTPFELSLFWTERKPQRKPIVRLVNDVIPPNAEMTRTASLTQSLRFIYALKRSLGTIINQHLRSPSRKTPSRTYSQNLHPIENRLPWPKNFVSDHRDRQRHLARDLQHLYLQYVLTVCGFMEWERLKTSSLLRPARWSISV